MKKYILKRLLQLIPVVILVSIFSFLIIQAAPGDPINNYVKSGMTEEQVEQVRKEYGLDGNIAQQYGRWLGHVLQGDLGTSMKQQRPVAEMIGERLPNTIILMGMALFLALIVSIPLGLWPD